MKWNRCNSMKVCYNLYLLSAQSYLFWLSVGLSSTHSVREVEAALPILHPSSLSFHTVTPLESRLGVEMASTTAGGSSSRAGASSSSPSRPASSSSSSGDYHSYELLYSKSRVTLHPTPYSKDNIPGYLAILKRKKRRSTSASPPNGSVSISSTSKADSPPKRSTTQDNSESILISWLPEVLVKDRSETAKFVDVELREAEGVMDRGEETEECLVKDIPSGKVLSMKEVVEDGKYNHASSYDKAQAHDCISSCLLQSQS